MMRFFCSMFGAILLITGCSARYVAGDASSQELVFYLVRHAEKANDGSKDPPLNSNGNSRAQVLADLLSQRRLVAVYSTNYQRTRMTAAPAAATQAIEVTLYDAKMPADEFAATLRDTYRSGGVLIVGHSNTTAQIAAALCTCQVAALHEDEYDRLITVRIDGADRKYMNEQRY